ncbi:hypothetical protein M407DRAFT_242059 [Tulasnella calospora MUT 4182]|uniref:Uncharacterized protein n=1 Tax=Tulasnella calospora MUT 4182 TaxID=1051891 RepID=A0A0C3QGP9_9AGAM|nr:hypothetical protein M407DRAFT_242059 [Tulasnella calospora MUT 4182]
MSSLPPLYQGDVDCDCGDSTPIVPDPDFQTTVPSPKIQATAKPPTGSKLQRR